MRCALMCLVVLLGLAACEKKVQQVQLVDERCTLPANPSGTAHAVITATNTPIAEDSTPNLMIVNLVKKTSVECIELEKSALGTTLRSVCKLTVRTADPITTCFTRTVKHEYPADCALFDRLQKASLE